MEIKESAKEITKKMDFISGEIATFKEALCTIIDKANNTTDKMFWASIIYFLGSLILSGTIAFAALVQAKILR
ncbi:MAG: hypothetical protein WC592_00300 [Candidatus Omnitrophota bacterium]